jgi:hypothetical protein
MGDWTQDPPVVTAIREFEAAHARWLKVAPADGILRTSASIEQQTAFDRMHTADRAYVWARDTAIHRVTRDFSYDEPYLRWPAVNKINLAKSGSHATARLSRLAARGDAEGISEPI